MGVQLKAILVGGLPGKALGLTGKIPKLVSHYAATTAPSAETARYWQ